MNSPLVFVSPEDVENLRNEIEPSIQSTYKIYIDTLEQITNKVTAESEEEVLSKPEEERNVHYNSLVAKGFETWVNDSATFLEEQTEVDDFLKRALSLISYVHGIAIPEKYKLLDSITLQIINNLEGRLLHENKMRALKAQEQEEESKEATE